MRVCLVHIIFKWQMLLYIIIYAHQTYLKSIRQFEKDATIFKKTRNIYCLLPITFFFIHMIQNLKLSTYLKVRALQFILKSTR